MSLNESVEAPFAGLVARSAKMQNLVAQAMKFAMSDAPLLIQGETGTGKI